MKRREFIALVGGIAATWPLPARAQQPGKLSTIGFLGASTAAASRQATESFLRRLHELGWIEGRTVMIEYRWVEGRSERYAEIAAEFVRLQVNVIVTVGGAVSAVKEATSVIPIVFPAATDPLGSGSVASLARPGGNITGLSSQMADTARKRLELLREVVPDLRRLAIMANGGNPSAVLEMRDVQGAARTLGLEVVTLELLRADEIATVFDALKTRADALYVATDPLFTYRVRINTLALSAQLPTIYIFRENVEAGGLLSYGANLPDLYRRAAAYVDKILRGAKPADLPVDHPTKFDLIINLTTAKALGTIPPTILVRADEVIECDGGSSLQGWVGRLRGQLWRGHSSPVRCGISAYC